MSERNRKYGGFGTPDNIVSNPIEEEKPFPEPLKTPEKPKRPKTFYIIILILLVVVMVSVFVFVVPQMNKPAKEPSPSDTAVETIEPSKKYNDNGFRVRQTDSFFIDRNLLMSSDRQVLLQQITENPDMYSSFIYETSDEILPKDIMADYSLVYTLHFTQNSETEDSILRKIVLGFNGKEYTDELTLDDLQREGIMYIDVGSAFDQSIWQAGTWSIRILLNDGFVLESQLILGE